MSGTCRDIRLALGVYVLGAIDPAERAGVDEHLAVCLGCREELASLAGLPALLGRVPAHEAARAAGGPRDGEGAGDDLGERLLPGLAARVEAARRARLRRVLAVAAAGTVLALGGGAAAGALWGQPGRAEPAGRLAAAAPEGAWRTATATGAGPATKVTLTVRYAPAAWGTDMAVQVGGVRPGTVCRFVVTGTDGRQWTVGSWRVPERAWSAWYPSSTALNEDQIRGFALMAGNAVLARAVSG